MRVLREMVGNLFSRPCTILYPNEKVPVPEGFRGRVAVREEYCIGCSRCVRACPAECIRMVEGEREMEVKGKKMTRKKRPEVEVFKCIRCGLCEETCPGEPKAIYLTCEFTGAGSEKGVIVS